MAVGARHSTSGNICNILRGMLDVAMTHRKLAPGPLEKSRVACQCRGERCRKPAARPWAKGYNVRRRDKVRTYRAKRRVFVQKKPACRDTSICRSQGATKIITLEFKRRLLNRTNFPKAINRSQADHESQSGQAARFQRVPPDRSRRPDARARSPRHCRVQPDSTKGSRAPCRDRRPMCTCREG